MARNTLIAVCSAAAAFCATPAWAAPGAGTLADPIVVDAFPYVIAGSTTGAPSSTIDTYNCAAGTNESGPEVVYRFSLPAKARVTAWVQGDGGAVDIDIHLLDSASLSGSTATACAARGNVIAEADMAAGEHYAIVDSYDGAAQAGDFVLHLYAIGDAWVETIVADGVKWRARRFEDLSGGQVIHQLVVDPSAQGVSVKSIAAQGCQTVSSMGQSIPGAVAGVNGGFFEMISTCPPVSMLKADGVLKKANDMNRGSFGISAAGQPLVSMIAAGQDWPEAWGAHGGGPMLAVGGTAKKGQTEWASQGFSNTSWNGVNPRTVAGIDGSGRVNFFTADGREEPVAIGLPLDDLAAFAVGSEMGLVDVVNLDGGGSTTFWVAGATPNGVVNYPSGGGLDNPTHGSQRAVSGGFFVVAPPYNHPPRFQTLPVTAATASKSYVYDADAIDLDVGDVVTFAIGKGPADMQVDATTGAVTWQPSADSLPNVEVTLQASDPHGATTPQTWSIAVQGATGAAGAGGAAGAAGNAGSAGSAGASGHAGAGGVDAGALDGSAGDSAAATPGAGATDEGGCTCGVVGSSTNAAWIALLSILAAIVRRKSRA
jgi:hypothetical protein